MRQPGAKSGSAPVDVGTVLNGRLVLHQMVGGHRAGTDAVLLAAASGCLPGDVFVDVGAGVGTVGLAVALMQPDSRGLLIERDAGQAALAARNAAANGLDPRVQVRCCDIFDAKGWAPGIAGCASLVLSNPPFYLAGTVRRSPDPGKEVAHVMSAETGRQGHGAWLRCMLGLLQPHGRFVMIHRPDALPDLLAACDRRAGSISLRPVHPREGKRATRLLIAGVVGSKAPVSILPPLILHRTNGPFTEAAAAIHAGEPLSM